jgi:uncharacterized NAD(P)/FAD-binding protein YdhS/predicted metal-dependent enzyme (double-stranded beta helix superfamily)
MSSRISAGTKAPPSVERLVANLTALGGAPTVVGIQRVLQQSELEMADLADFVQTDPRRYHRSRVAWTPAFEVLVMTWLPGQCSPPHDHGGSICAMRVIRGTALERTYQVAEDGLADACMEERIPAGRTVAGDDAGVHSVHNLVADGPPLVTLHVYAPPLRDYRRFVPRPQRSGPGVQMIRESPSRSVCIIGGGFSGVATAVQLLQAPKGPERLTVHLIERRGTLGEGPAYGTREPEHLLNVPARNMSLLAQDPGHFLRWLQAVDPGTGPTTFAPRQRFGEYLRETLEASIQTAKDGADVHLHLDEARRVIRRSGGGWLVHLARGASVECEHLIVAAGHRPPGDPFAGRWQGPRRRWIADPWRPHVVTDIAPDEPVVIVGSGLTAVDMLLSLTGDQAPRRRAPICMLTRTGLLPRVHTDPPAPAADLAAAIAPLLAAPELRIRDLLRWLRPQLRQAVDWRGVIDGLRTHTTALWQRLPLAERRRFLRHLQGLWEVHRHRTAASVGAHVQRARDEGLLQVVRCRIDGATATDEAVSLRVQAWRRGQPAQHREFEAAWVINCTGPASAAQRGDADPAIASLIEAGLATPDPLGLGLETTPDGQALDHEGRPVADLGVVGTLRKPGLWESTAVPELREQARQVALGALRRPLAR